MHHSAIQAEEAVFNLVAPLLSPLGYEVVAVELKIQRPPKKLRIFIDRSSKNPSKGSGVSIDDCVRASQTLDNALDTTPLIEKIFKGHYELEISSPGIDRPLKRVQDFEKFTGNTVKVHVFRPLTEDEINNSAYLTKNPKQKNFQGVLEGIKDNKVLLSVTFGNLNYLVKIPLSLITRTTISVTFAPLALIAVKAACPGVSIKVISLPSFSIV